MNNLTQITFYTRRAAKIGAILMIVYIVGRTGLRVGTRLWRTAHPEPAPAPTVSFGKLPAIIFPDQLTDLPEFDFKLETIEGGLPQLATITKVFFMPKMRFGFLTIDRAKLKAQKMGFRDEPQTNDNQLYRWSQANTSLEMNIVNGNFKLAYDFRQDPDLRDAKNLPTYEQAVTEAKSFLVNNGFFPQDLAEGSAEFKYLYFDGQNLTAVNSISEANFIRINFFRQDIDELRVLPPDPKNALISFLFSSSREPGKRIVNIEYTYFPIEKETFGTYPLKTVDQAWQELKDGQGFISHLGQNQNGQVIIRKVYLAFYDAPDAENFLQPIFVFEGDREFFGYVPAIESQWSE